LSFEITNNIEFFILSAHTRCYDLHKSFLKVDFIMSSWRIEV